MTLLDILNTTTLEPLSPMERLAASDVHPTSERRMTDLEAALFDAARVYQEDNVFMVWHMHEGTGEFTGFSIGGLTRVREEQS